MKNILFKVFISFSLFHSCFASVQLDEILQLSRESRSNTKLSKTEESLRVEKIYSEAYELLPVVQEDSLEICMQRLLETYIGNPEDLKRVQAPETILKDDKVILFVDKVGTTKYVCKAFKNPKHGSSKFIPEISALDFISDKQLSYSSPITPLAVGKCICEGQSYALLLESAATGHRLDEWIYLIAAHPLGSLERLEVFENACEAYAALGKAAAELHSFKHPMPQRIPEDRIKKLREKYKVLLNYEHTSSLSRDLDLMALGHYIEALIQRVMEILCFYSYCHGDMHLGNVFYDSSLGKVYFIDVAKMHLSFDNEGLPLTEATIDLVRAEENLKRKGYLYITPEEIAELTNACIKGYEGYQNNTIDPALKELYTTYVKLGRLKDYSDWFLMEDPFTQKREKGIYEEAIQYFNLKMHGQ